MLAPPPTPPALIAAASLQGQFQMTGRVRVAVGLASEHVGQKVTRSWAFAPLCTAGQCASVRLTRTRTGGIDTLVLQRRSSGYYTGNGSFYAPLRCAGRNYRRGELVPFAITVRITAAAVAGNSVVATALRASYTNRTRTNLTPCVAAPAHDAAAYRGQLATGGAAPSKRAASGRSPAGS